MSDDDDETTPDGEIPVPEGLDDLSPFAPEPAEDAEYGWDDSEYRAQADAAYADLLARVGESAPQPRLDATRRAVELLGDPHRAYPIIHVTGTNGKTSTSRMIESILRAYGLRTGLLTSPHLERVTERIAIDGRPISNRDFAANWEDIQPYLLLVDNELQAADEPPLTMFEALTVLAFACFADAPVDVAVVEVGLGGEWDSTNVADGQVAVITSIALDHTRRLGNTTEQIARTKSGIIKPLARVVSAIQPRDAADVLVEAARFTESTLAVEGQQFALESTTVAVGGQLITVRGLAERYSEVFLPLLGEHQAHNAAVAIAAVESFLGDGSQPLVGDVLEEGLGQVTSPGRLQVIGTEPTVIVDAAHNPHGAQSLTTALGQYFDFDEIGFVLGVLGDKDARGIVSALAPVATRFFVAQSDSDRSIAHHDLTTIVTDVVGESAVSDFESLPAALHAARGWAVSGERRAVVATGSIVFVGEVMTLSTVEGWRP
jgi:dihydrofolate synthase/folylpolyglutamate synthase